MKPLLTKERIEKIRTSPGFAVMLADMRAYAEQAVKEEDPSITYDLFSLFFENGDRAAYEKHSFERRRRFNAFGILYLLERDEKWKRALENCIFAICTEATWALPAHIDKYPMEEYGVCIDLFSSETGQMLCELLNMVRDELSPIVVCTAEREVRRRIIEPFMKYGASHYWWSNVETNWAAVCACGVGSCFFHLGTKEETAKFLETLPITLESFLKSFDEDGCCLEGYTYWVYGFGRFVYLADLLYDYSDGKINIMKQYDKVHRVADFANHAFLGENGEAVTFADGVRAYASRCITAKIHEFFPDLPMLSESFYDPSGFGREFVVTVRDLAWFDGESVPEKTKIQPLFVYGQAQWYIRKNETFRFAAKGGTNFEPHNHNDLGSFILLSNGVRIFDDYGAGRYTRQYFTPGERYKILVNSSLGHSVPIVNGLEQVDGPQRAARFLVHDENTCEFDIARGYDDPTLQSLLRHFDILSDGIRLTDSYVFTEKPKALTERFVTLQKPDPIENGVRIGNWSVKAETECAVTVSVEKVLPHRVKANDPNAADTMYIIDFVPQNRSEHMTFTVTARLER